MTKKVSMKKKKMTEEFKKLKRKVLNGIGSKLQVALLKWVCLLKTSSTRDYNFANKALGSKVRTSSPLYCTGEC